MLQSLNFSQLYYFKLVVDQGSIAKASEVGNITASAISMQIKALETFLNKELFSRKKRSLVLTKDGTIVYEYAKHLFKVSNEMLAVMKYERNPSYIKIDIGVQHDIPKNLVAKITSYIFSHFKAHLNIYVKDQDRLTADLINNEIDLAILNYPPIVNDKYLIHRKCVLKSPIVFAGSKEYLSLKGKGLSQFHSAPIILPTSHLELRRKLDLEFARHNVEMNVVAEVEDLIIKKNMAMDGNGIIPVMKRAVMSDLKSEQLYILHEFKDIEDEIWLVTNKSQRSHQVIQNLMKDFSF